MGSNRLKDRVAMVTGGSRGIGRAAALKLAQEGAAVVVNYRKRGDEAGQVVDQVQALGGRALAIQADVADQAAVQKMVEQSVRELGPTDILVNNAGGGPPRTSVVKARPVDWTMTLRTNLWATMLVSKLVLPAMIAQECGAIINICSQAGLAGRAGEAAYAAAKFGVRGFNQALLEEVREKGVKVSTIFPGFVDTVMIPPNNQLNRSKMLSPQDVAEAVYNITVASPQCCPAEVVLQPQYNPLKV